MSSLNFPLNPTVGQLHVVGSKTYIWNGSAWIVYSQNVTANVLTTNQVATITTTTNATTVTDGALIVDGGVGIAKDVYIGGYLRVDGNLDVLGTTTLNGSAILTTGSFAATEGADIDIGPDPLNTSSLIISNISTLQSVTDRGSTTSNIVNFTNITNSTSTTTGAVVVNGGIGVGGRVTCESVRIADVIFDSTRISINTTSTTEIDSYHIDDFRCAKYLIQIDEGSGPGSQFELIEILLAVDNGGTVYATEYGLAGSELGDFSASLLPDDIVRLYFTANTLTNKTIKVLRTGIAA